jgi:hypothetical protein
MIIKRISLVLGVVLVIGLAACGSEEAAVNQVAEGNTVTVEGGDESITENNEDNISQNEVEVDQEALQEKFEEDMNAVNSLSKDDTNLDICDDINDEGNKSSCIKTVTINKAIQKKDIQICDSIQDTRSKSYCVESVTQEN